MRLLLALIVALLLLEGAARLLDLGVPPRGSVAMASMYVPAPETVMPGLGKRLRPGARGTAVYRGLGGDPDRTVVYEVNALGFRGRAFAEEKPPGVYRIAMVGDSVTFGTGVDEEQTMARVLERELSARLPARRFEVLNAGVPASNTGQHVALLRFRVQWFDPDLVFFTSTLTDTTGYGIPNEEDRAAEISWEERLVRDLGLTSGRWRDGEYLGDRTPAIDRAMWLRKHSVLADFLANRLYGWLRGRLELASYHSTWTEGSPGLAKLEASLAEARSLADEHGFELHVGMFPFLTQLDENYPFQRQTETLRGICDSLGIPFVDLLEPLRGREAAPLKAHVHDRHPGPEAHELVGRFLADYLMPSVEAGG